MSNFYCHPGKAGGSPNILAQPCRGRREPFSGSPSGFDVIPLGLHKHDRRARQRRDTEVVEVEAIAIVTPASRFFRDLRRIVRIPIESTQDAVNQKATGWPFKKVFLVRAGGFSAGRNVAGILLADERLDAFECLKRLAERRPKHRYVAGLS